MVVGATRREKTGGSVAVNDVEVSNRSGTGLETGIGGGGGGARPLSPIFRATEP